MEAAERNAKSHSLVELLARFPDDASAEAWLVEQRWPEGELWSTFVYGGE